MYAPNSIGLLEMICARKYCGLQSNGDKSETNHFLGDPALAQKEEA